MLEETLSWPFFDESHRRFADALSRFANVHLAPLPHGDVDAACRARVKALDQGAGRRRMTLELWAENQRAQQVTAGEAEVVTA